MAGSFHAVFREMVCDCVWAGCCCVAAYVPFQGSYQHSCKQFVVHGMELAIQAGLEITEEQARAIAQAVYEAMKMGGAEFPQKEQVMT